MTRLKIGAAVLGLMIGVLVAAPANAWKRGNVQVLAVLPDVTPGVKSSVEGLTVGPDGNIYVSTFGFNTQGAITGQCRALRDQPERQNGQEGHHRRSSPHMLGLAFNPVTHDLLVLDFGAGKVLKSTRRPARPVCSWRPGVANSRPQCADLRQGRKRLRVGFLQRRHLEDRPPGGGLNRMEQRSAARSAERVSPRRSAPTVSSSTMTARPYVRGQHRVSSDHPDPGDSDGTAGAASIFITGINAPDGIVIDRNDNIWICANQEDEIVVIDKTGKVIAKLGDFNGIDPNGIPRGFLFPASLAFSKDGSTLYVSNLTL